MIFICAFLFMPNYSRVQLGIKQGLLVSEGIQRYALIPNAS